MKLFTAFTRRFAVRCLAVLPLLFLAENSPLHAQTSDALKHSVPPPPVGVQKDEHLGSSVAVRGAYAVVGAPEDDTGGSESGSVKVFDSTTGALLFVINDPKPGNSSRFGYSVAVSGSRVVIGALRGRSTVGGSGTAYVFNLASATPTVPEAELTYPNPVSGDNFGAAVSMDGQDIVVGSPGKMVDGQTFAGVVYVYSLVSSTPTVPVLTLNNPAPEPFDQFGYSVAVNAGRIVVGALEDSTGADSAGSAYVYELASATPSVPVVTLNNPAPGIGDKFGTSVAVSGVRVAVSAPNDDTGGSNAGSVYAYNVTSATPTVPVVTINATSASNNFGNSLGLSGSRLVVGHAETDTGADDSGSANVYDLGGATPNVPVTTLANPSPADSDSFGFAVAVSGTIVLIGAPYDDTGANDHGVAHLYDAGGATPTLPVATLYHASPSGLDQFGYSVAVAGVRMVVGAPYESTSGSNSGSAFVYNLSSATPTVPTLALNNPNPSASDNFGLSVAAAGLRVVVSAPYDDIGANDGGRVYVYNLASGTPAVPSLTLNNPSPEAGDLFGRVVAIAGTRIVVGEPSDNTGATDAGRVYVYDTTSGTPTLPVFTLNNPSPAANDNFGRSVAISGTRLVVGAPRDATAGPVDSGAAYVYDLAGTTPSTPILTLTKPGAAAYDNFGYAVAVSGTRVAVSAYLDDQAGADAGAVFVFDTASPTPGVPLSTLQSPDVQPSYDNFGNSISLSGSLLAVGADLVPSMIQIAQGTVYLFDLDRATPTVPVQTFRKSVPSIYEFYGRSVSVDGTTIAVGSPGDDTAVTEKGYAYVFGSPTTTTDAPVLTAPAIGASFGPTVVVNFSLPEAALPGTVKLVFRNGATSHVLTLAASEETAGAHSFSFDPAIPTATAQIAYGAAIPEGTYEVALSYQDTLGSRAAASNVATGVLIDIDLPRIFPPVGGFKPLAVVAGTPLLDYRPQAVIFNGAGVTSYTQTPAPGGATAVGAITVTLTVTNASGADSRVFTVNAVSAANDTDGDGLNDAAEVQIAALGFDWQTAQPALVNTLLNNANGAGLYTTSQIQTLNVDVPLLTRDAATGIFKLTLGLKKSTSLPTFTPFPMTAPQTLINADGKLEFYFSSPDNAAFFRVEAK